MLYYGCIMCVLCNVGVSYGCNVGVSCGCASYGCNVCPMGVM